MIIDLDTLFPQRKSLTSIVSYTSDAFAAVDSKVFASLPADVQCGDVIGADGALYASGTDAFVVVSEFITAGTNKAVNVLRAPNVGSYVALKSDNLHAANHAAAISALQAQGFATREFFTS
ncbi:hypothetical protein [Leclercia adecarboxylata]|uniref:hypothetical protein n=1 Tax=Leclercia adecarboxylata TaxID=83655 RepID=UPI002949ACF7|nr:hypothetical protein [Leclercia adecarboxylata]MDV5238151.1 hypothetical protein [Leclercia adecarboxylata]MDV5279014.1 hypothetical protein [Leclercia adecarboxylata]MDV5462726.1 hypothetical protein [Leclercia adecarboxylata]MDV5502126.1 hypothetical protein [Leclercia adecarboxylata]MDV5530713.1 hypothetical protein [Leclercia adecarboxylata]